MNTNRQSKSWMVRYSVGTALTVLIGYTALKSNTLKPKLIDPSYDLPFINCGIPFLEPRLVKPKEVVLILMDEDSHRELNQPYNTSWDRALYARLLDRLTADGARAVVFDILFTDPHPTKPEGDSEFARAIKINGNVVLGAEFTYDAGGFPTAIRAIDPLFDAAAGWGIVQLDADDDLTVRRHFHVPNDKNADNFSSLTWATAQLLDVPETQNPDNRYVKRWMNYYGPSKNPKFPDSGTIPSVSFHLALETNQYCPSGFFTNKVVFVGGSVKTYFSGQRKDEYRTPYTFRGEFVPGVEVQATEFLNLIRHDWLTRFPPAERWFVVLAGLVFGIGLARFRPIPATGLALLGAGLITFFACFLFWKERIWFPWLVTVAAQIPVALLWSILYNSVSSYVQNRLLEQSLSLYLSPKQVQRILKDPGLRQPGGNKQVVSILFSDIAGFSRVSEQLDSQELIQLLNSYYEATIRCIHKTEGTVVDIIGDAIFAVWNAPEPQEDHRERMLAAALMFQQHLTEFNGKKGRLALHTRVGLHTGEVTVGNVGSSEHFDYTAIGENVNLASRLEGLNKQLGTDVLMTRTAIPPTSEQWLLRPVGLFRFKGFENTVEVIELVVQVESPEKARTWSKTFAEALSDFQAQRFDKAEVSFKCTLELRPEDGPSNFYLNQIAELREHSLPDNWNGEVSLKEK